MPIKQIIVIGNIEVRIWDGKKPHLYYLGVFDRVEHGNKGLIFGHSSHRNRINFRYYLRKGSTCSLV